ncbi:MAG: hypothetical protein ACI9LM_001907 [Alteromonadaceae bacterium]|jgi:hypothetical protein
MKILILIASLLVLSACGGDQDNNKKPLLPVVTQVPKSFNIATPSLEEITGVWDSSTTDKDGNDENYFIIQSSGEFVFYDYAGDDIDQGEGCYWQRDYRLTDGGDGKFSLLFNGTDILSLEASIIDGELSLVFTDSETQATKPSTMLAADFLPEC